MDSEDGQVFVKNLAYFVRTHEKALANALQLQRQRTKNASQQTTAGASSSSAPATSYTLADALSRPYLAFTSQNPKPAKLTLTPHHLYYLLTKFEDLGVDVGPMNVRLENIHAESAPGNYVSFLGHAPKSRGRQSDADSLRSVSSVRSVMSSMSSVWSAITLGNSAAKAEKQMAQHREDIKYLYSCFTKIPALRLAPDHRARLIEGYEEFPFDTAVPLFAFKNVSSLEITDLDFRQFYGWDRLSESLRSLTIRRGSLDDPIDLLLNIVLDDMDKRRKRSSRAPVPTTPSTPGLSWTAASPKTKYMELARSYSAPNSPLVEQRRASLAGSPGSINLSRGGTSEGKTPLAIRPRERSDSPVRPASSRHASLQKHQRNVASELRRSSGSSNTSLHEMTPRHSTADLLAGYALPPSKWRFLRHLSLAENGLTFLTAASFAPVAGTLYSLDLSGNLFTEIPDALASLTHLRALNLSNCMIESLHSLARSPLPAIASLNLRSNRLLSLAGIERCLSLEKIDVRDNRLHDPSELARLTSIPELTDVYVTRNPFTRTHSNFRVTILNVFRSTPGHAQDIVIDGVGPTYNEKKQLVDRAPELANVPVVKPAVEEESPPPSVLHEPSIVPDEPLPPLRETTPRHTHRRTTSDISPYASQSRRKKAPRRRIVELSQAEAAQSQPPAEPEPEPIPQLTDVPPLPDSEVDKPEPITPGPPNYTTTPTTQIQHLSPPQRPTVDTSLASPTPSPRIRSASSSDEDDSSDPLQLPQDVGSNTDLYRQKIEALKSDLGPNWLTALSENNTLKDEARSSPRNRSFSPASRTSTIRPENPARGVSVGGRTLG